FTPRLAPPQLVKAQVGDDPVNPGVERALEAKIADVPVSLQKRFLVNVLSVVLRSSQVQSQPQHLVLVLPDQRVERRPRSRLCLADQLHFLGSSACLRMYP